MNGRVAAVGLLAFVWPAAARAGNADSFYYSDDAALSAGSVVAMTRDSGAIWYNPAGLGGNARGEVDFNGTALGLRIRPVPKALSTRVAGDPNVESSSLNATDFFSAPHALTFIRNVTPQLSVGFGLYVTSFELRNAESQTSFNGTAPSDAGTPPSTVAGTYRQRIDVQLQGTAYHAGPAIGYAISPDLRVGATLFGTYSKAAGFSQYFIDFNDRGTPPTTVASFLAQDRELLTYIGIRAQGGVQYDAKPDWHLGLLVRSPEFLITSSDDGAGLETVGLAGPGITGKVTTALTNPKSPFSTFDIVTPMRVIASVSHDFAPKTWLAAEADFQTGVSTTGLEQRFTVNGRVGGNATR